MDWPMLIVIAVLITGITLLIRLQGSAPPSAGSHAAWLAQQQASRRQRRGTD